jgi:NAD+ diphosphatase
MLGFEPAILPPKGLSDGDLCFSFFKDEMLVRLEKRQVQVPNAGYLRARRVEVEHRLYLGKLNGAHCYAESLKPDTVVPRGMKLKNLRRLYGLIEEELFWVGGRGFQLINWERTSQFCGSCGHRMKQSTDEVAKVCPSCGFRNYPRISPAIIVAVTRENRILLARAFRFPYKLYSVIAGFVEPGETLEDCVRREIREEVGVEVMNIRYFGSQPWPFPNSLMIAFTADYAGGELRIDEKEIMDAGWYAPKELPPIPDKVSIARRLIDSFVGNHT